MQLVLLGIVGLIVCVLWGFACISWFETREIWNRGVCRSTGRPWMVVEISGTLYLDDGKTEFVKLGGIIVHPAITDSYYKQMKRGVKA